MVQRPKICFGMGLYNNSRYLPATIESILQQTYNDFSLIAIDDCSDDDTNEIMQHYASKDKRIYYIRNEERKGNIYTWRRAFKEARKVSVDYFAWASDHDIWHPEWLQNHVAILNKYPQVVLVYPFVIDIGENDEHLIKRNDCLDTSGMKKISHIRTICKGLTGAGYKVYGLFRAKALAETSIYSYCIMPDRLLLLEISIFGRFSQIEKFLWYRRFPGGKKHPTINHNQHEIGRMYDDTVIDQRLSLFRLGKTPHHSYFPFLTHAFLLVKRTIKLSGISNPANFFLGFYMAILYLHANKFYLKRELKLFNKKYR